MDLQYIGQTTFKSLNKKKRAIFFSPLRKVFIVVPLTYILPIENFIHVRVNVLETLKEYNAKLLK